MILEVFSNLNDSMIGRDQHNMVAAISSFFKTAKYPLALPDLLTVQLTS